MVLSIVMPFTRSSGGGSFISASLLAKGLIEAGHEVTAVFPAEGKASDLFRKYGASTYISNMATLGPIERTPIGICSFFLENIKILRFALNFLRSSEYDVIHCNDDTTMLPWALAAKANRITYVWHVRTGRAGLLDPVRLPFVDRALCISNFVAQRLPDTPKKSVLYNPVDTSVFMPAADKSLIRRSLGLPSQGIQFIHIGRDASYKRPEWSVIALTAALKSGLNASLVFLGDYTEERQERLRSALPHNNQNRVIFPGWVNNPESWLSCSDLLLHPATAEHFGRVFIEAAACEVPFVATDKGAAPELVAAGLWGFIHSDWAESSFQSLILEICQGRPRKIRMSLLTPVEHAKTYLELIG